ncbi:MAG: tellurite resistance TerB family protein [Sedimentitalea sp.]
MSLMGTLAKLAIGYAAARGVEKAGGVQGLAGMFGGAQVAPGEAAADQAPGMGNMQDMISSMTGGAGAGGLQDMLGKMTGGAAGGMGSVQDMIGQMTGGAGGAGGLQDMMAKMAGQSGFDMSSLMGGATPPSEEEAKGGLLAGVPGGGTGLAGILAAAGGAAALAGKGAGDMIDQFGTDETAPQGEETAGLMLRAMIQAAKADGDIDAEEQAKIMDTVGDDARPQDIAFVREQLAAPVDVAALARDTPDMQKMQVYSMSLMSIRLDTQGEAQYLDGLAKAMGLNQQVVNALHLQMGVQPLYG